MPRKKGAGTWEGHPAYRWTKMVRGTRWRLLCRGQKPGEIKENTGYLNLPESQWSKSGSMAAANAWWDSFTTLTPEQLAECQALADKIAKFDRAMQKAGIPRTDEMKPLAKELFLALDKLPDDTPAGTTLEYWSQQYFTYKLAQNRSPGRFDNLKRSIERFVKSIGASQPVKAINWNTWDTFEVEVRNSGLGETTQRDVISDVRQFVRWLERRDIVPPVKNLSETHIKISAKAIEHFSRNELRELLSKSNGILRCFLLLFCNCGFRQSDVATLTPAMLKGGYITRQRAKTKGTNAPTVSWKLWSETLDAISHHKSTGHLLFTRDGGQPWVVEKLNEKQKRGRDDAFRRELWTPFAKDHSIRLSSDKIRASCANLLKTSSEHTNSLSVQIKYLGQSPSGVALRHYIDPSQSDLDDAVMSIRALLLD